MNNYIDDFFSVSKSRLASPGIKKGKPERPKKLCWYDEREKEKSRDFIIQQAQKISAIWDLAQTDDGTRVVSS